MDQEHSWNAATLVTVQLLLFTGERVHVCVLLDLHRLFWSSPYETTKGKGWCTLSCSLPTLLACFSALKSQESPWKMLEEGCLILASLWCIPLEGWKPKHTSQTNSFALFCLLFLSVSVVRQLPFCWATSLKGHYDISGKISFLAFLLKVRSEDSFHSLVCMTGAKLQPVSLA